MHIHDPSNRHWYLTLHRQGNRDSDICEKTNLKVPGPFLCSFQGLLGEGMTLTLNISMRLLPSQA